VVNGADALAVIGMGPVHIIIMGALSVDLSIINHDKTPTQPTGESTMTSSSSQPILCPDCGAALQAIKLFGRGPESLTVFFCTGRRSRENKII
jgi:hypothetical protein